MKQIAIIGRLRSSLQRLRDCPLSEHEGVPEAVLQIDARYHAASQGLKAGQCIWLLTRLHLAGRCVHSAHPRNNSAAPVKGVFATRSPDGPDLLDYMPLKVWKRQGLVQVAHLEVLDGTTS